MNTQQKIVEDAPLMRSVAMMSSSPMPLARTLPLVKSALVGSHATQNTKLAIAPTASWKVNQLMTLPSLYFLERSNCYIDNAEPEVVAARIAECLRSRSIATTFFQDEAKVQAETQEHVQFTVQLWSDKDQVVVEVQRGAGCCFLFCQTCKAILRAAKGDTAAATTVRCFTIPDCVPQLSLEEEKQLIQDDLEIAADLLLTNNKHDAHLLGIQSLAHLSKVTKCRAFAAQCILGGDFLPTLLSLVESYRMDRNCNNDNTTETLSVMEEEHFFFMHRHALAVLSNCLTALEASGELQHVLEQNEELCSVALLTSLVNEMAHASERPHEACYAVQCINSMVRSSTAVKQAACELGAIQALDSAYREGVCRHANLATFASKLQSDIAGDN